MANVNQVNPFTDPTNPYFLHLSEGPGAVLVLAHLIESNYHSWCRAMTIALELKDKMGFMDGSIQELEVGNPIRLDWERNNKIILAWMV